MNSVAQGPQLIWVPDDYELIQAAINAATDFDTIRVRDGIYYETLNLFGKGLWIESENGPMECTVDANFSSRAFRVPTCAVQSTIRGFLVRNGNAQISPSDAILNFYNNIVISDSGWTNFISSYSGGEIRNNLFSGSRSSIQIGYHWGVFYNNIIVEAENVGFWNAADFRNPLEYGYNALWGNFEDYFRFEPGIGDVYSDPLLNMEGGYFEEGSPCIDAGHPEILDNDSTRSDIGPWGGPWAYN